MEIEVILPGWNQCISGLRDSEQQLKKTAMEIDEVSRQLMFSEDPSLQLTGKKLHDQVNQTQWRAGTIQTFHMALEKIKHLYLENEEAIGDGMMKKADPIAGIQVMPGFADKEWFEKVQTVIKLKG